MNNLISICGQIKKLLGNKNMKNNSGGVLVLVMGMITIMLIMGLTFLTTKAYEQKVGLNHKDSIQAQYIAEAGAAMVIQNFNADPLWRGTIGPLSHLGGTVTATAADGYDTGMAIITSTGQFRGAKKNLILSVDCKVAGPPGPTDQEIAYHLAEVGVQMALDKLETDPKWTGTIGPIEYEGGTITVTCVKIPGHKVEITSMGQYGSAEETIIVIEPIQDDEDEQ